MSMKEIQGITPMTKALIRQEIREEHYAIADGDYAGIDSYIEQLPTIDPGDDAGFRAFLLVSAKRFLSSAELTNLAMGVLSTAEVTVLNTMHLQDPPCPEDCKFKITGGCEKGWAVFCAGIHYKGKE